MILNKRNKAIILFVMKEFLLVIVALVSAFMLGKLVPETMQLAGIPVGLLVAFCAYCVLIIVSRAKKLNRLPSP